MTMVTAPLRPAGLVKPEMAGMAIEIGMAVIATTVRTSINENPILLR